MTVRPTIVNIAPLGSETIGKAKCIFDKLEERPTAVALLSLVVSIVALLLPILSGPPSKKPIVEIIESEASLAQDHAVDKVVALFKDGAIVRDEGGPAGDSQSFRPPQYWSGKAEIRKRYETIKAHVLFSGLKHFRITVEFDAEGTGARAASSTQGLMQWDNGPAQDIATRGGEEWEFEKINGQWKIASVIFHERPTK